MDFPAIDPVAFEIGPLVIRWYALAYLLGFVAGWGYALKLAGADDKERPFKEDIDNFMVWAIPGVILGGRIGYVLFYNLEYYIENPFLPVSLLGYDFYLPSVLAIWHGGMSFHGGIIGVGVVLVLFCWKHDFLVFRLSDIVACVAPIGLFLGRIANFVNGELYGRVTDSSWGMVFPNTDGQPRHPSQLYEAFLEGIILFIIMVLMAKKGAHHNRPGIMTAVFLMLYGAFRYIVEFVREPDEHLGLFFEFISMGQILCMPMIIAGLLVLIISKRYRQNEF